MFEPLPSVDHPGVDPRTDFKEPKDRERLIAQYDGDIAYGDGQFGRFIDGLKKRGIYDEALNSGYFKNMQAQLKTYVYDVSQGMM